MGPRVADFLVRAHTLAQKVCSVLRVSFWKRITKCQVVLKVSDEECVSRKKNVMKLPGCGS